MEYFDVCDMPEGCLRATFLSQSALQTERLGRLFASVATGQLGLNGGDAKIRIGLKGQKNNGKTTFSLGFLAGFSDGSFPVFGLNGWSNKYALKAGGSVLHYDPAAINTNLLVHGPDYMPMRMMKELSQHDADQSSALVHLVEWPERDPRNTKLNVLWEFVRRQETQCRIKFSSTHEIAAMPETRQFLEDAAEFRIVA